MVSRVTFRVNRRRRKMYCGHPRLCVCLCAAACLHYCTDPDDGGMPIVVHYWADLQSVHGLRCYGNITRTRNVSEYMLVLALCLVYNSIARNLLLSLLVKDFWVVVGVPSVLGVAGSPSNTNSPGPRPTSIPSAILAHPVVCPQRTLAENLGDCVPLGEGKLASNSKVAWDEAYLHT